MSEATNGEVRDDRPSYPSLKCSDIGFPECSHVAFGAGEETLIRNAKYHAITTHSYTEESWEQELARKINEWRMYIKMSTGKL